jgi:hypothetical protein
MGRSLLVRLDPVDRYRRLCAALRGEHGWTLDRAWLRFAAQAAVLRPAEPEDTARAAAAFLAALRRQGGWGDRLHTAGGQMIAAALVQIGDTPAAFGADLAAARGLMHAAGLPRSTWYELKSVAALRLIRDGAPVAVPPLIARVQAIHAAMSRYHWWTTGRHELPTCALMACHAGEAAAVTGAAEAIVLALQAGEHVHGHAVQTAAGILTLTGLVPGAAYRRHEALTQALAEVDLPRDDDASAIAAMLCLLDHHPAVIAHRLGELHAELTDPDHPAFVVADLAVAADLCFLDLLRCDRRGRRLARVADDETTRRLIRLQRGIAVVIADVAHAAITPEWPLLPFI